jgi:hypothetical protein
VGPARKPRLDAPTIVLSHLAPLNLQIESENRSRPRAVKQVCEKSTLTILTSKIPCSGPRNSLIREIFSLLCRLGFLLQNRFTERRNPNFPSRESTRRRVRSTLRRQPASPVFGGPGPREKPANGRLSRVCARSPPSHFGVLVGQFAESLRPNSPNTHFWEILAGDLVRSRLALPRSIFGSLFEGAEPANSLAMSGPRHR